MRTYRVTIRGRFVDVPEPARDRLRDVVGDHGVLTARYTPEGTVTFGPELRGLVFRFETSLDDDVVDPGQRAATQARDALRAWAARRGVTVTAEHVDVTCMDDIKIPRRRARRSGRAG